MRNPSPIQVLRKILVKSLVRRNSTQLACRDIYAALISDLTNLATKHTETYVSFSQGFLCALAQSVATIESA